MFISNKSNKFILLLKRENRTDLTFILIQMCATAYTMTHTTRQYFILDVL
jgi:hypothetical protein